MLSCADSHSPPVISMQMMNSSPKILFIEYEFISGVKITNCRGIRRKDF
jgi:hypothetical protein